jgi:lysophospholipase L1-like esterase
MSVRCYVAMGDSFTAGNEPGVPSFADRVGALLASDRYVNLAAVGARSSDVLADQYPEALSAGPDLVSLICGANDVVRSTRPDLERFELAFDRMLAGLGSSSGSPCVVTATYPEITAAFPVRERTRERVAEGLGAVNDAVRRLSASHGAHCLDLAAHATGARRQDYADDGFHPSASGHHKAALAFASYLRDRLGIRLTEGVAAA